MYNDEKNLYHYTYRKSGREEPARDEAPVQNSTPAQDTDPVQETAPIQETAPVQDANPSIESQLHDFRQSEQPRQQVWAESAGPAMGPQPEAPKAPKAKKTSPMGLKIAALALSCAILGGAAGAGVTAAVKSHSGSGTATVNVSDRTASQVVLKSVDGKTELTDAENYAANVNSVVSINCSATTNYFGQTVESASSGSGFLLTQDGFVVTNHHVIDGATSVKVTLYDGETYDATVIGSDSDYDIAVLKIDAAGLPPVTLGDSSLLNVGLDLLCVVTLKMGVAGAGWATLVSQLVSGILCLVYMAKRFPILRLEKENLKFQRYFARRLLVMGLPMGLQYSVTAIGSILLQTAVNGLGSVAMAAVTASGKVINLFACPYDAMGTTAATYAGQNLGAGKLDRVNTGVKHCAILGTLYALVALAAMYFGGAPMSGLFLDSKDMDSAAQILPLARELLVVNAAFYISLSIIIDKILKHPITR